MTKYRLGEGILILLIVLNSCSKNKDVTLPTITTTEVTDIKDTSAKSGGNVVSDGGSQVTHRGVCWGKAPSPSTNDSKTVDGSGGSIFTSSITGLISRTKYFVRAYATNSIGTAYGNEISFTSTLTDSEGNIYTSVTIGTQAWMVENLKTTKYANGELIPNVIDATWGSLATGAWSNYNNDPQLNVVYGKLYNFYAVADQRKICPSGWHVPTDLEWTSLENTLGGSGNAGGKMKETGTTHWLAPNTGADNSSGFTGLPGGNRRGAINSVFETLGTLGRHWSSTGLNADEAWARDLSNDAINIGRNQFDKKYGFSIRCVQD